jgi:hypothetical protein
VVAFIALTFFGGSALLGSFGDLTNQLGVGPQEVQSTTSVADTETEEISSTAKDAATPAFLGSVPAAGRSNARWPHRLEDLAAARRQ